MIRTYFGLRALGGLAIDACLWVVAKIRGAAYARVMGHYYEFRGNPIDMLELDDGQRWLSIRDTRRSLPTLTPDSRLQTLYPGAVQMAGKPRELRVEARALEQHLLKARDPNSIRFLRWLQREVIFPAQKKAASSSPLGVDSRRG